MRSRDPLSAARFPMFAGFPPHTEISRMTPHLSPRTLSQVAVAADSFRDSARCIATSRCRDGLAMECQRRGSRRRGEKGTIHFNSKFINIFQYVKELLSQISISNRVAACVTARVLCPKSAVAMTGREPATRSAPEQFRFTATDFNSYVTVSIAEGALNASPAAWPPRPRRAWASNRAWRCLGRL
jgi:hypothetical protein